MLAAIPLPGPAAAQTTSALPSPLTLSDVIRLAGERRDEIETARARLRAGEQRPTIVSALDDPMFSPSLDHLPFMLGGADVSFAFEQQFPLSGIRGHRRPSALADVEKQQVASYYSIVTTELSLSTEITKGERVFSPDSVSARCRVSASGVHRSECRRPRTRVRLPRYDRSPPA